jgi:hypothetical protein
MGIFKSKKVNQENKNAEVFFKEAVKEINELYDDVKSEYEDIETAVADFTQFVQEIKVRLTKEEEVRIDEFVVRLSKVNRCARNSVRDIRDVLRSQKKRLGEVLREQ